MAARCEHGAEASKLPKGVNWAGNGISVGGKGGVYVASNAHLRKVVWNGTKLSTEEKDGAWKGPCFNSSGRGSGSTPTVVGFGNEPDELPVATDGDLLMNIVAFWREEMPEGRKQVPGIPPRRIAGAKAREL